MNVGELAPSFSLPDHTGKTTSLADFLGTWVVLYFYPKDDTPGCTKEACDFRDAASPIKSANAIVLGISADNSKSHTKFREKFSLPFPLLVDTDKIVCEAYGVWKKGSMFGKNFMGIERATFVIDPAGKIAKMYPKVKVEGHVADILNFLRTQKQAA